MEICCLKGEQKLFDYDEDYTFREIAGGMPKLSDYKTDEITTIKVDKDVKIIDQADILIYDNNHDFINYYTNIGHYRPDNTDLEHTAYFLGDKIVAIQEFVP